MASALATVVALALGLLWLRRWLAASAGTRSEIPGVWRYGSTVWLTGLANFGLQSQSDVLMLGLMVPDKTQIGLYRAAVMPVQRLMGFVLGGWQGLAIPMLSEAATTGGPDAVRKTWTAYVKFVLLLSVPLLILLAATSATLIPLLYSSAYEGSVRLCQLYALASLLGVAVGHGVSTKLMQTLRLETLAMRLRLMAGLLNIVLNLLLIPRFGAAGAVLATSTAGALMWLVETRIVITRFSLSYPWAFALKVLLASAAGAVGALVLPGAGWFSFFAQCAIYGALTLAVLYFLKPLTEAEHSAIARLSPRASKITILFLSRASGAPA